MVGSTKLVHCLRCHFDVIPLRIISCDWNDHRDISTARKRHSSMDFSWRFSGKSPKSLYDSLSVRTPDPASLIESLYIFFRPAPHTTLDRRVPHKLLSHKTLKRINFFFFARPVVWDYIAVLHSQIKFMPRTAASLRLRWSTQAQPDEAQCAGQTERTVCQDTHLQRAFDAAVLWIYANRMRWSTSVGGPVTFSDGQDRWSIWWKRAAARASLKRLLSPRFSMP